MDERPVPAVLDNADEERLEAREGEHLAFLSYSRMGDLLYLLHTEVPPEMGGRGVGAVLLRAALDRARAEEARVVAFCPFARTWLRRHPEYRDLVVEEGE